MPNCIKTLALRLGPDFMSDIFTVETSNNAKLEVSISYNWHFRYDEEDQSTLLKIMNASDFVGDAVRELNAKVVAEIASKSLDEFHKNSAQMIRTAVFGEGKEYFFPGNNLVITDADIRSVECVDKSSQESLKKTVQMAIQITTNKIEQEARAKADKEKQDAENELETLKLRDNDTAEDFKKKLSELNNQIEEIKDTSQAIAVGRGEAMAQKITTDAANQVATLQAQIE